MMWTFLMVVVAGGCLVIFSDYWLSAIKQLFSVPGVALFLPLITISWLMLISEAWVIWCVQLMHAAFHYAVYKINAVLPPFMGSLLLVKACLMAVLAWIPTFLIWLISKPYRPFEPPYWVSIYVFVLLIVLVILK